MMHDVVPLSNQNSVIPLNGQKRNVNVIGGDNLANSVLPAYLARLEAMLQGIKSLQSDSIISITEYNGTITIENQGGEIKEIKLVKRVDDIASNDQGNVELEIISNADIDKLFR